jgi:hypothetical protein
MKLFLLLWTVCALAISAPAEEGALSRKLSEANAEWLVGEWTGIDPQGDAFTLAYGMEFDGQAGSVHFQSAGMEMKGLIVLDSSTGQIRQFAATSIGVLVTGTWDEDGNGLTFESTWKLPDGTQRERTFVYQWVDAQTARVVLYEGSRWQSNITSHLVMLKRAS